MRLYWHQTRNFGDAIAPAILEHFTGERAEFAGREERGKAVSTGSVIYAVREGDAVWGAGLISQQPVRMPIAEFAAVRGPLTRDRCGIRAGITLGDTGLLLPLVYRPEIEKKHKLGILPHYVDKPAFGGVAPPGAHLIDVLAPWRTVVDEILSCEAVVSSSLHGIVAAEAYGVPVSWAVFGDRIIGGQFKFQDYFLGTGRPEQVPSGRLDPIGDVGSIQERLIGAMPWKKTT